MIILVMGLSGSGKTTLAKKLSASLGCLHINADEVRNMYNDWDFSLSGRVRQASRLHSLAHEVEGDVVVDFICPTHAVQEIFNADYTIWMDTVSSSKYKDTDEVFESPKYYDRRVTEWVDSTLYTILKDLK